MASRRRASGRRAVLLRPRSPLPRAEAMRPRTLGPVACVRPQRAGRRGGATPRFSGAIRESLQHRRRADRGTVVPRGANVRVLLAPANRDPEGFAEPDEFRLDQQLSRHVAFGCAIHYRLGVPLARLEAGVAPDVLMNAFAALALPAPPRAIPSRRRSGASIRSRSSSAADPGAPAVGARAGRPRYTHLHARVRGATARRTRL